MKRKPLLVTSAIISLSLLNVNVVRAENISTEVQEENQQMREIETNNYESFPSTSVIEEENDSPIQDENIKNVIENNQVKFDEIIEQLHNKMNTEQNEILLEFISEKDNILLDALTVAVTDHDLGKFKQASEKYEQLILEESLNTRYRDLIIFFNELSVEEILLTDMSKSELIDEDNKNPEKINGTEKDKNIESEVSKEEKSDPTLYETLDDKTKVFEEQNLKKEKEIEKAKTNETNNDYEKTEAISVLKSNYRTAEDYYYAVKSSDNVSEMWSLAQESKTIFGSGSYVKQTVQFAAESNLNYAIVQHQRGNYDQSLTYYTRVMGEELVSEQVKRVASIRRGQAEAKEVYKTAEGYYQAVKNSSSASEMWSLAQESKTIFGSGSYVEQTIQFAAKSNLNYAIVQHQKGNYDQSLTYYTRVMGEELASDQVKRIASIRRSQAEAKEVYKTAEGYYQVVKNSSSASEMWNLAQESKTIFISGSYVEQTIQFAAKSNLNYAMAQHQRGNYDLSLTYYTRVIEEELVLENDRRIATIHRIQAQSKETFKSAADYYNAIINSDNASEMWNLAQESKTLFLSGSYVEQAIKFAVESNLNYAIAQHKRGNYARSVTYYTRIIEEDLVSANDKKNAEIYRNQAETKETFRSAEDYYRMIIESGNASEIWNLTQELKELFVSGPYINQAINYAVESNLNYAIAQHKRGNYQRSLTYYNRVINEEEVEFSIKFKAKAFYHLANNKLKLTNYTVVNTNYNTSLSNAINIQVKRAPQISHNGGWRNATKDEVMKYLNPKNSVPGDITYSLTMLEIMTSTLRVRTGPNTSYAHIADVFKGEKYAILDSQNNWYKIELNNGTQGWVSGSSGYISRDTDVLQHLVLSGSSGISVSDLNKELENKGILTNQGSTFRQASREANINELYLISHALLETGNGSSSLAKGILVSEVNGKAVTPRVVYNMFGIGAVDSDPERLGSERAYQEGWFSPKEAIIGGAKWISSGYINNITYRQDTLYKMRWNPLQPGTHQYATDIAWASKQTKTLDSILNLSQKYNLILLFDIPVYQD